MASSEKQEIADALANLISKGFVSTSVNENNEPTFSITKEGEEALSKFKQVFPE